MPFKKGSSGNPGGIDADMRRQMLEVRRMALRHCAKAIQVLVDIVSDPTAQKKDRSYAADKLLDRGLGKAVQALEHSGPEGEKLSVEVIIRSKDG